MKQPDGLIKQVQYVPEIGQPDLNGLYTSGDEPPPAPVHSETPYAFAGNASTGILLSTLWNQSGVIQISGNSTITYNEYCPLDNGTHSVTGCTNTAAAQIIYYYIEKKGFKLNLTLTTADEYKSGKFSIKADGSTPGTISFTEINQKLSSFNTRSADDIAALNYACGVVQEAQYSARGTSTGWNTDLFYRAGFDCVVTAYSRDKKKYYWFQNTSRGYTTFSDAGFEVLIENLTAGRIVGISSEAEDHALLIDGYNSSNDTFHLNYGWGSNSATRWYTRDEMANLNLYYVLFDLLPEATTTLTVSDNEVYGTGTLLRAYEQAAGIKGANTVDFSTAMKGKSLSLQDMVYINDKVTTQNFNMHLIVTESLSNSWGQGFYAESASEAIFNGFSGALIVNTTKNQNAAFYAAYSNRLVLNTDKAVIYAGNYISGSAASGANAILRSLQAKQQDLTKSLSNNITSNAGYIVFGSTSADTVTLNNRTVAIGEVYLNSGDDTLTVTNNSCLYGDINGANGTDTLIIDSSSFVQGCFYAVENINFLLNGSAGNQAMCHVMSNVYNVEYYAKNITVDISDALTGSYTLFKADSRAEYASSLASLQITVAGGGNTNITLTAEGTSSCDYAELIYENEQLILKVTSNNQDQSDRTPPSIPAGLNATVTGKNAALTWESSTDNVQVQGYKIRYGTSSTLTGNGTNVQDTATQLNNLANGTYYYQICAVDTAGNCSDWSTVKSFEVNYVPVLITTATADITSPTNRNVTVSAVFADDAVLCQYSLDNKNWMTYPAGGIIFTYNGIVYFRSKDADGAYSPVISYQVSNIDKTPPEAPVAQAEYGNGCVIVSAEFSEDSVIREYSLNNRTWQRYTQELELTEKGTVYFRSKDAAGNISGITMYEVVEIAAPVPANLQGTADQLHWDYPAAANCQVEITKDAFAHVLSIEMQGGDLDLYGLPADTYQWRVSGDNSTWYDGNDITAPTPKAPVRITSDADGDTDLFFANANGVWKTGYIAEHQGILNTWEGTGEQIGLAGKNKIANVFTGSADPHVLFLTDDANGDALFIDDIYTALGDQARVNQIREIRAGAGDDIVDMTSQQFACSGDGMTIYGGAGNDVIWANSGSNTLFGDSGNDRITGGSGNDVIIGGAGNDTLLGGGGNDTFYFGGEWGEDTIEQLSNGRVTLWFENGSRTNWNNSTMTYDDGQNRVSVSGVSLLRVSVKFGVSASSLPDGAFADAASEKIFEDKNKGMIA